MWRFISFVALFSLLPNVVFAQQWKYEAFVDLEKERSYLGITNMSQFGSSMAYGDFNDDGIIDLAIGAPLSSYEDVNLSGAVVIFYGGGFKKTVIWGMDEDEQIGHSLAVGDLDGNGVDDLIIGSYRSGTDRKGKVYVVDGLDLSVNERFSLENAYSIDGVKEDEAFGLTLHVEDLNNDGYEDLIVGAPWASFDGMYQAGIVYVFFNFGENLSLNTPRIFYGTKKGERFGSKIVTGHLHDSVYPDLVIGAYKSDSVATSQGGAVYMYKGRKNYSLEVKKADKVWYGHLDGQWFGFEMLIDDGKLFVSSFPYWRPSLGGEVFLIDEENNFEMKSVYDSKDIGERLAGSSLGVLDINGDGVKELLVGALPVSLNRQSDYSGAIFALEKPNYELVQTVYGSHAEDWFGSQMVVYDGDGDGFDELFISSPYFNDQAGQVVMLKFDEGYLGKRLSRPEDDGQVSRGEMVKLVIDGFDLKERRADEYAKCLEYRDFCLFNFIASSSFQNLNLEGKMILYPDVNVDSVFYEDVTFATALGIVKGYVNDYQSPFRPELPVTRIQSLKIVLGALGVQDFRYKFEIEDVGGQESLFADIDPKISHMWWYPRYANFAKENGLLEGSDFFRPDELVTMEEALDLIERGLKFINAEDEKVNARGSSNEEAVTAEGDGDET